MWYKYSQNSCDDRNISKLGVTHGTLKIGYKNSKFHKIDVMLGSWDCYN